MSDQTDDQGAADPVVPTDEPTDAVLYDERDDRIDTLQAQLAEAQDRIAELESAPPGEVNDFGGVRTPALDAFEENQFKGEVQAWERDTGLSYEDTEPEPVVDHVDPAIQAKADAEKVG